MEEAGVKLKFELLWPKFEALREAVFNGGDWTTQAFSAAIVGFLLFVFFSFLVWVFVGAYRSRRKINFFSNLLGNIKPDELVDQRRALRERANQNRKCGDLWIEFDETLVISPSGDQLWNTIDASNFFNPHTLASGITESRLIAAVPGFLTAVGVIGTFAGLQLGLSGLNLAQDQQLSQTSGQIQILIGSAAVAFLTSVWGVLTSVVFNFIEKYIEQLLRGRIAKLQDKVDSLFPRIRPEQKLIEIEDHSRESRNTLQGLAEKIGDRMQESLLQMSGEITRGISTTLAETLSPAVEKLVSAASDLASRQAESSTQALESLVQGFVTKVGEHAEQQKAMMNAASAEIRSATASMGETIQSFVAKMETQSEAMRTGQLGVLNSVNATVTKHAEETRRVLALGEDLATRVSAMSEDLTGISEELRQSTNAMQQVTGHLEGVGGRMEEATKHFSDVMARAMTTTASYVEQSRDLTEIMNQSLDFLSGFDEKTQGLTANIERVATIVRSALHELEEKQTAFLQGMQSNLEAIEQQVADLMRDYGERVTGQTRERLDEWNQQTRQFSESMVSAVQSIHDVVADIEVRTNGGSR